jgi:hypothetical protein
MSGPIRTDGVEVNDVADGIIVYRSADDTAHHLNPLATLVYELCDGRARTDLVATVADFAGLDPDEAERVVASALVDLRTQDLVSGA